MGDNMETYGGGGESGAHGLTTTWPQVQESSGPPKTQEARQDLALESSERMWF